MIQSKSAFRSAIDCEFRILPYLPMGASCYIEGMASEPSLRSVELVLLDRDGVINVDSEDYIKHPDDWHPIPGALEAIAELQKHVRVAVCTNQSGVGRGLYDLDALTAIHETFQASLRGVGGEFIDIFFCPHHPDAGCSCRKPLPGLLYDAMKCLKVAAHATAFVGDSARDLDAAMSAHCLPVLVRTGNGVKTLAKYRTGPLVYDDLAAFAKALLAVKHPD